MVIRQLKLPAQVSVYIPEAAMNLHMYSMYRQREADATGQYLRITP